jgi:heptosyltransferase-1
VEEAFSEIPAWHPAVRWVMPIALRRWRKTPRQALLSGKLREFVSDLRRYEYDLVLDAQGLIKSALVTRLARGRRAGLDRRSAREPFSSIAYQERYNIVRGQHAIDRNRRLFGAALGYSVRDNGLDYGLTSLLGVEQPTQRRLLFFHGTTWETKHWPESYWCELARIAAAEGYQVRLPSGNLQERERAERIAEAAPGALVLPPASLSELASELVAAAGVVGADTGLCHLAAAFEVPSVTLYGPTRSDLTGTRGRGQLHLTADFPCAPCLDRKCGHAGEASVFPPCFEDMTPDLVWNRLTPLLKV